MHHNLVTAIFISVMETNLTSGIKHYKHLPNNTMFQNCDLQKSCLEFFDPDAPVSKFVFAHNVVLIVIGVFGILGNILSIVVLSKPEMRSSINHLLIGLTYCDTFVVLFAILLAALGCVFPCMGLHLNFNFTLLTYIYVYFQPIWYAAQVASVYLTIAITIERFIAVCYPFEAKDICTIGRAKQCNYLIIIISILYHIPTYWENGIVEVVHDECNITVTCAYSTDFSKNEIYFTIYWEWLHSILTFLIPFAGLMYFNIRIFIQMEKAKKSRRKLTGCTKAEKDQTKILFGIVAVFFVCNSTFPLCYIYQYFFGMEMSMTNILMNQLAMSLYILNSCLNFLVYIFVGKKFRKILKRVFKEPERSSSTTINVVVT